MSEWVEPACSYAALWLEYQHRHAELPGLQYAMASHGRTVAEGAFGKPALSSPSRLTSEHLLRVASHSKAFTATGIMKLVDAGKVCLDDPAGRFVANLHRDTAQATIRQLLSHTAGVTRDGTDAGQWQMRRPFLDEVELRKALAEAPVLVTNTRFKYSNHGYGLLGLIIESASGEPYKDWIKREVVAGASLKRTLPDGPFAPDVPLARGHGLRSLLGERFEVDVGVSTGALVSATGFASTAGDLAAFFAQLDPHATTSLLSPASRREMTRRHWRIPDMSAESHYGLGLMEGGDGDWAWFGHSGVFPGCFSHTGVLPAHGISISVIINAVEVPPALLVDGIIAILRAYRDGGPPTRATAGWSGRWWSPWAVSDLVPMDGKVIVASPGQVNPMLDTIELADVGETSARIAKAGGFLGFGEAARLERDASGTPRELWLGGTKLLREAEMAAEVRQRFRISIVRP